MPIKKNNPLINVKSNAIIVTSLHKYFIKKKIL